MQHQIIEGEDIQAWRAALAPFERVDVCQMPEYHLAYSTRIEGSRPLLCTFEKGGHHFAYPFLLTPIIVAGQDTGFQDISSIYGYSGPLSTTQDKEFLQNAWQNFDKWAQENKIIAEFIRFSLHAQTRNNAHPETEIVFNRPSAVSHLPESEEELFAALGKKTRNMLRKAEKSGLSAREMTLPEDLPQFRKLYEETMDRNDATAFFSYDDAYYNYLLSLPPDELRLFGVYDGQQLVAAAISLSHKQGALYHLGASRHEFSRLGAGNLALLEMSKSLMKDGIQFLHVGGGRTTAEDDPLFRFKKSNAIGVEEYFIGKRVLSPTAYQKVVKSWEDYYKTRVSSSKLLFYRED